MLRRRVFGGSVLTLVALASLGVWCSAPRPVARVDARAAGKVARRIAQHLERTERSGVQIYFDRRGRPSDAVAFFAREPSGWSAAQYLYRREGDQLVLWLNRPDYERLDGDVRLVLIEGGVKAFAVTPGKQSIQLRLVVDDGTTEVEVDQVVPLPVKKGPPRT